MNPPLPLQQPSLLGGFAHPDDEVLLAGGVLAHHAAAGAATAVVTATWAAELADALAILGAGKPRMLGYADAHVPESAPGRTRLCEAPVDDVVGRIVGHIRELRPDIVIFPVKFLCSVSCVSAWRLRPAFGVDRAGAAGRREPVGVFRFSSRPHRRSFN